MTKCWFTVLCKPWLEIEIKKFHKNHLNVLKKYEKVPDFVFTRHRQGFRFHLATFRNRFQRVRVTFSRNFDPISCAERKVVLRLFSAVFNSLRTPVKTARSWLVWRGLMVIYLLNNITTIVSEHDWNCSVWSAWKCYETFPMSFLYM